MDEEYAEEVLDLVEQVPPGRAVTYGQVAELVGERLGRGGPRIVGAVMARMGGSVPWWRVVNARGEPPRPYAKEALRVLRTEGCPLVPDGDRVDLGKARWAGPGAKKESNESQ